MTIEWTDETWNPIRGCSRVSEGCRNCYAERQAARHGGPGRPYEGLVAAHPGGARWTGKVRLVPELLDKPRRWRGPRRIFVNSMSDLFHEGLTDGEILRVFLAMLGAPHLTFQVLTKRENRMAEWFRRWADVTGEPEEPQLARGPAATRAAHPSPRGQMFAEYLETLGTEPPAGAAWPTFDWMDGMRWWPAHAMAPRHIHFGVSAEDQASFDRRTRVLLSVPVQVRWVSLEPLLEPVDARGPALHGQIVRTNCSWTRGHRGPRLDWVVVGGESGPGARPCDVAWIRSIVGQCREAGVACFVKQLGTRPVVQHPTEPGALIAAWCTDPKGGDPDEWPEDLRVRQQPNTDPGLHVSDLP